MKWSGRSFHTLSLNTVRFLDLFCPLFRKKRAQQVDAEEDGAEGKTGDTDGETKPEKAQETEEVGLKNKESSSLGLTESHNMPEIA